VTVFLVSWLATYALHSTVLLGGAFLVNRWLRSDRWRESLCRTALIGALITASLAPLDVTLTVARRGDESAATGVSAPAASRVEESVRRHEAPAARADAASRTLVLPVGGSDTPVRLFLYAWAAIAVILLSRFAIYYVRLRRALAGRCELASGPIVEMVSSLRRQAGLWKPVAVFVSDDCPLPLAIGMSELCLPSRFAVDLTPEQQRAVLGHEIAHLHRADAVWQQFAFVVESLFFFQPLNVWARREMRAAAERLCDDWAAEHAGAPLDLAKCLTKIASWTQTSTARYSQVLAIADGGSPLTERVRRLADWSEDRDRGGWLRPFVCASLVITVVLGAPRVTTASATPIADPGLKAPSEQPPPGLKLRPRGRSAAPDAGVSRPPPKSAR
jgi:beta-lactamase regulating signal transducer with metallopeptidase domain